MEIKRFGDRACIVEFGEGISREINSLVINFHQQLKTLHVNGITDLIPAYNSLTIVFDPQLISFIELSKIISQIQPRSTSRKSSKFMIPVCYEMALDKDDFCRSTGLQWEEIIELHMATTYLVYMIGFLPGFLYMGEVDQKIQLPRKKEPRKKVEMGSVGIAGMQTGIYPMTSPGGWNILGRTPISLFNPEKEAPFPIEPGSKVQFAAISRKDFDVLSKDKNYQIEKLNAG